MASMLAHIGALGGALLPGRRPVRRREPRLPVQADVAVVSSHGDRAGMMIGNVSAHGCNVRGEADWLRLGCFVSVVLDGSAPVQAIVRWVRDGSAGLEFLRPVPGHNMAWRELINSISNM